MKKKCLVCGTLNDSDQILCTNPDCKESLVLAEEVFENDEMESQDPASENTTAVNSTLENVDVEPAKSEEDYCTCKFPVPIDEGDNAVCICGKPIQDNSFEHDETQKKQSRESDNSSKKTVKILLPDIAENSSIQLTENSGLLLGREPSGYVPSVVSFALSRYGGVSRRHAWLGWFNKNLIVYDLASRNGTYLDNRQLTPYQPVIIQVDSHPVTMRLGKHAVILIQKV